MVVSITWLQDHCNAFELKLHMESQVVNHTSFLTDVLLLLLFILKRMKNNYYFEINRKQRPHK